MSRCRIEMRTSFKRFVVLSMVRIIGDEARRREAGDEAEMNRGRRDVNRVGVEVSVESRARDDADGDELGRAGRGEWVEEIEVEIRRVRRKRIRVKVRKSERVKVKER